MENLIINSEKTANVIVNQPSIIGIEDASTMAPALINMEKHESRSDKYSMVPTVELVKMFQNLGWDIRNEGKMTGLLFLSSGRG